MSSYSVAWAWAFAFTQLIEAPIYRRLFGCGWARALGASAITHPLIWLAFPHLPFPYVQSVALVELFAWLGEALYFARPYGTKRALWVALITNFVSCTLGFLSRSLFGAP
jgi:hypothetical protein